MKLYIQTLPEEKMKKILLLLGLLLGVFGFAYSQETKNEEFDGLTPKQCIKGAVYEKNDWGEDELVSCEQWGRYDFTKIDIEQAQKEQKKKSLGSKILGIITYPFKLLGLL